MSRSSRIPGFYTLPLEQRLQAVKKFANLSDAEAECLNATGGLKLEVADRMIENVIGSMEVPLGIAANFLINGKDYLIPMAIEEPSVVAAANNAARMTRAGGGIWASTTGADMIGQIQLVGVDDPDAAQRTILGAKDDIIKVANNQDPILVGLGGGAKDVEVRVIDSPTGSMVITHLIVDVKDAMGANAVNTMVEAAAPLIEEITGGRVFLRIVSNLTDRRLVRAKTTVPSEALGGEEVVDAIIYAYSFAAADPYRAATHNKGIMNGVVAVALAVGNDTRALEAGAHAYAARTGRYGPLTTWVKDDRGDLSGTIEMPMAVGIVGGATKVNPVARAALKVMGVKTAAELAEVMGAVGLAQNLAALRALATEGIQRGHMSLHARNVAVSAGAKGEEIDEVAGMMVKERGIRIDRATEILKELRRGKK